MKPLLPLSAMLLLTSAATLTRAQDQTAPATTGSTTAAPDSTSPSATTNSTDKVLLRLHLQSGQNYLMRQTTNSKVTQILPQMGTTPPQRMDLTTINSIAMLYAVQQVDANGTAAVKVSYRSIQVKFSGKMGQQPMPYTTYDSDHPGKSASPIATIYKALIGQSVSMKISSDGHISDIQGLTNIKKRLLSSMNSLSGGKEASAAVSKMMGAFLDDRTFKASMEKMTATYPEHEVGIGDSWPFQLTLPEQLPLVVKGIRTLKERKDGIAYIEEKGNIQLNANKPLMTVNHLDLIYHLGGTQTGMTQLDEATGFVGKATMEQRFSGTITMTGMDTLKTPLRQSKVALPHSASYPLYSKTTIQITTEPFKPAGL
ncbi:MAG: hypothetical protein JO316_16840 [Abitibacteriaceae bacterium]|nr:hypothetical protein [Abditibacteriaceae bacterium]MBV9867022.1 hypothetical protein [Abditibacteriaceae bacterium]